MAVRNPTDKLIEACRCLFGHDFVVSRELLNQITPADLNLAFSKQLKARMPRNAKVSSLSKSFFTGDFKQVTDAYTSLLTLFESSMTEEERAEAAGLLESLTSKELVLFHDDLLPRPVPPTARQLSSTKTGKTQFYRGTLPRSKLRFATFLYYKGVIDQNTLADALQWQKRCRPLIGQIAVAWDFIDLREFAEILYRSKDGQAFGQVAKRRGRLTDTQIAALLSEQERFRKPIGQFFIQKKILTKAEIEMYLLELEAHNLRYV
jgi:hypothetical protein